MPIAGIDPKQRNNVAVVDLLDRQPFIDQLISITEILSANKKNACFALNGAWGVGKSFVLEMFEEQVSRIQTEETTMGKYLLFHYDCWKYDYYEEPLTAIVAALLDSIDKQIYLFSEEKTAKIKGILKVLGTKLANKLNNKFEEKTGVNPKDIWDVYNGINDDAAKRIAENHEFDSLFDFNRILNKLRETLNSLAKDQTVIIVVDELDRCLPEYTIKVLERLHHVLNGIPNIQTILSIDKEQLEHTVKQIYGSNIDDKKYLEKFISFEITLPIGSLNNNAEIFFEKYFTQFENVAGYVNSNDLSEFKHIILEGINTRSRIAIIEKCTLIHNIISKDNRKTDVVYMCIEIFLTLLKYYDLDVIKSKENFSIETLFEFTQFAKNEASDSDYALSGFDIIRNKIKTRYAKSNDPNTNSMYSEYIYCHSSENTIIKCHDIWGILFACYRAILGFKDDLWHFLRHSDSSIKQYAHNYWVLLKTID